MPRLRVATPADAPLVLALTLAAYEEYRDVLVPESGVFGETIETVRSHLEGRAMPGHPASGGPAPAPTAPGDLAPAPTDPIVPARSGAVIASVDGEAVGCARWSVRVDDVPAGAHPPERRPGTSPRSYLYVGRVAVLPAHRGRGVATALMAWCEGLALDRGLREVRLGVRLGLARNEALYRRLGYRPTGSLEEREGYGPIAAVDGQACRRRSRLSATRAPRGPAVGPLRSCRERVTILQPGSGGRPWSGSRSGRGAW